MMYIIMERGLKTQTVLCEMGKIRISGSEGEALNPARYESGF